MFLNFTLTHPNTKVSQVVVSSDLMTLVNADDDGDGDGDADDGDDDADADDGDDDGSE